VFDDGRYDLIPASEGESDKIRVFAGFSVRKRWTTDGRRPARSGIEAPPSPFSVYALPFLDFELFGLDRVS
jgi:hypothetical protein